jgi:peptidoglycan hydrolase-like protein with peptidoglycan-binding domain
MKKFLIAATVVALAVTTVAAAATFNANLTVGSRGADVTALQQALIAGGYSIPAGATGYFGSQTQAAVKLYQAAKGIPNTGFVGPLTRAALNGGVAVVPAAGCPAGYVCTPITPTTPSTAGSEGLITTKLAASPVANASIRESAGVPVWGIEVKAQGSAMIVDRVLIQMQVGVGGAATSVSNPATFVKALYAYDGSTLLKGWTLGASDFNKDSSDRYYVIASGLNFAVPKDTSKVLTFKVDTSGVAADMTARYLTVQGYAGNSQNVRAIDAAGLSSYTDMSGTANSRVQVFTTSGASTLTVTANSGLTPKSTNNKVDSTDGVKGLTTQVIDIKSTTGASKVVTVDVVSSASSTAGLPSTLYLYEGSTLLGSVSASASNGGVSRFSDLNVIVAKDQTKQLTVKADYPTTATGQVASTSIPATGIKFEKPDSTTSSSSNAVIASNDQYLYSAAPQWTLVSASAVPSAGVVGVASSSVTGTIVLDVKAVGGSMTKPVAADFSVVFASSTSATYTAANSVTGGQKIVTVTPTDATIGEDSTYRVTITDTIYSNDSEIGSSQPLFMAIKDIDAVVGGVTITNQTWGIDTFFTEAEQLTKGTQ